MWGCRVEDFEGLWGRRRRRRRRRVVRVRVRVRKGNVFTPHPSTHSTPSLRGS